MIDSVYLSAQLKKNISTVVELHITRVGAPVSVITASLLATTFVAVPGKRSKIAASLPVAPGTAYLKKERKIRPGKMDLPSK